MAENNENAAGSIRRSSASTSSSRTRAKKKDLVPFGIGLFVLLLVAGILLHMKQPILAFFWMSGIAFGFILQRSRFCFTASMRDPYLTGVTSITRAVLIALAITSIGFWAIKYGAFLNGTPIPGQNYIVPISLATVIGGLLFGIGMVIAGGCGSGTLMRVGEGFYMQVLSLTFFVIGSTWGTYDLGFWKANFIQKGIKVFLPDYLGWFGALFTQLIVIGIIYVIADKWENKKHAGDSH
jgi:uncharacterized membrane protein YedE/YeeE